MGVVEEYEDTGSLSQRTRNGGFVAPYLRGSSLEIEVWLKEGQETVDAIIAWLAANGVILPEKEVRVRHAGVKVFSAFVPISVIGPLSQQPDIYNVQMAGKGVYIPGPEGSPPDSSGNEESPQDPDRYEAPTTTRVTSRGER